MKRIIIILTSIILIFSCKEPINKEVKIFEINSEIIGQTFLNGNSTSEKYSPRGSFIELVPSEFRLWKGVHLFKDKREFTQKDFFKENETTILFDSLENGNYKVKFISHFNDEIEKEIELNNNLKMEFPSDLKDYYEKRNFNKFSIEQLKSNDTLQILYQHFGCFSFEHNLIEYILSNKDTKVRVADWGNNWREVKLENPLKILRKLIKEGKEFNGIDGCSNYDYYTFRKKGNNQISIIEDGSCDWDGIRMIMKKEN